MLEALVPSTSLVLICGTAWAQHIWQGLSGMSLLLAPEGTRRLPMAGLWSEGGFQTP